MAGSVYRSRNCVLSHTSLLCEEDLQFPGLFLTPSGQDSNWNSLVIWKMEPAFGQHSTTPPLRSCRSCGWMPPRSRDVFSFSLLFMPGISHRLSTVSVNNCLLQKTRSQWNLSKVVFSEMEAEDSETGCYFG